MRTHSKNICYLITSLAVMLAGLGICLFALCNSIGIVDMIVNGERAEALISESVKVRKSSGGGPRMHRGGGTATTQYLITVSYTDSQGVTHTAQPPIHDGNQRLAGERVSILYMPDAPERVMIDSGTSICAPTLIPLILGLAFMAAGIALWKQQPPEARKKKAQGRTP